MPVQVIDRGAKKKEDADFPSVRNFHVVQLKNGKCILVCLDIWFKRSYEKNGADFSANFASYRTNFAIIVFSEIK